MPNLHYQNLNFDLINANSDLHKFQKQVNYNIQDMIRYLTTIINYEEEQGIKRTAWRELSPEENEHLSSIEKKKGIWIAIDDPVDWTGDDNPSMAFLQDGIKFIYARKDKLAKDHNKEHDYGVQQAKNFDYDRKLMIEVLDFKLQYQYLCVNKKPEIIDDKYEVLLKPNTYVLKKQREALYALHDYPYPEWTPLLNLFVGSKNVNYDYYHNYENINIEQWYKLTDTTRDGANEQREFVQKALNTPDFAFLEDPPGSGKTTAISELIMQQCARNDRVLLSASTHVAIDNVIERLMAEDNPHRDLILPVRIGDEKLVSDSVKPYCLNILTKTKQSELKDFLQKKQKNIYLNSRQILLDFLQTEKNNLIQNLILDNYNLVCGTTIGILQSPEIKQESNQGKTLFRPKFHSLIVDEASKTTFQEFIVPALFAKKWILVGDTKQLSPYVDSEEFSCVIDSTVPNPVARYAALDVFEIMQSNAEQEHNQKIPSMSKIISVSEKRKELAMDIYTQQIYAKNNSKISDQEENIDLTYYIQEIKNLMPFLKDKLQLEALAKQKYESENKNNQSTKTKQKSEIYAYDLSDFTENNSIEDKLQLSLGNIMIGTELEILANQDSLPLDAVSIRRFNKHEDFSELENQSMAYRLRHNLEEKTWGNEMAWRIIRQYETKDPKKKNQKYANDIESLKPDESVLAILPEIKSIRKIEDQNYSEALTESLDRIRRIALPSVLESLQHGFERKKDQRDGTALTDGLPKEILEYRHVLLSHQHRMHPDIAQFSKQYIYDNKALHSSPLLANNRHWSCPLWASRMIWLDTGGSNKSTSSMIEVKATEQQLKDLLNWAKNAPENKTWEVAVLTFYRQQEKLLREMLRKLTNQKGNYRDFELKHNNKVILKISLCTVDRFQGQESDVVFLSFGRSKGLGFLDNKNRLNVALTRARYQNVIIGNHDNFHKKNGSLLKDLTDFCKKNLYRP